MSELRSAAEGYRSRPALELSGAQLGAALIGLRHVIDLIEVEFSKLSERFAQTDEWDGGGFLSPIHWIRVNCHLGGGAAADRITVGEQLAGLPLTSAALDEGRIGFSHLALIARTSEAITDGPRPPDAPRHCTARAPSGRASPRDALPAVVIHQQVIWRAPAVAPRPSGAIARSEMKPAALLLLLALWWCSTAFT